MKSSDIVKIAPSILAADFTRLGEQVKEAEEGGAEYIHVDVMDGRFVPNFSLGPVVVEAVRRVTSLPLPTHLMIVDPERYIADFVSAGADWVIVHVESTPHVHSALQLIKASGARAGVAINPATPIACLEEIWEDIDSILVMTVNPGFGGQAFIHSMLGKIRRTRCLLDELGSGTELMVDGGVNARTAPLVASAGADVLCMGTAVFGADGGIAQAISGIRKSIEQQSEVFET